MLNVECDSPASTVTEMFAGQNCVGFQRTWLSLIQ